MIFDFKITTLPLALVAFLQEISLEWGWCIFIGFVELVVGVDVFVDTSVAVAQRGMFATRHATAKTRVSMYGTAVSQWRDINMDRIYEWRIEV